MVDMTIENVYHLTCLNDNTSQWFLVVLNKK